MEDAKSFFLVDYICQMRLITTSYQSRARLQLLYQLNSHWPYASRMTQNTVLFIHSEKTHQQSLAECQPNGTRCVVRAHLRPCLVRKNFQDFPSHRIFGRMHGALNTDENKN